MKEGVRILKWNIKWLSSGYRRGESYEGYFMVERMKHFQIILKDWLRRFKMVEFNLSEKIVVEQFHTKEDVDELAYLEIEDVKEFIRLLKEDLMIKQEEPTQMVDEFNKEMFDNIDKLVGDELSK